MSWSEEEVAAGPWGVTEDPSPGAVDLKFNDFRELRAFGLDRDDAFGIAHRTLVDDLSRRIEARAALPRPAEVASDDLAIVLDPEIAERLALRERYLRGGSPDPALLAERAELSPALVEAHVAPVRDPRPRWVYAAWRRLRLGSAARRSAACERIAEVLAAGPPAGRVR